MAFIKNVYHYFLAFISALIYRFPSRKIKVVGVTGTKGKSTVISLASFVFDNSGFKTASLSSVFIKIGDRKERNRTGNTMPGRFFIQKFIRKAVNSGCDIVFIEVTSQGVVQHRHRFINWDKAVFLDIHPEHIESHGSFEKYLQAKVSFFSYVAHTNKKAIFFINNEDEHADAFIKSVGSSKFKIFSGTNIFKNINVPGSLEGYFNKINVACVYSLAESENVSDISIKNAIESFPGLLGRMDIIQEVPFMAVVDYAHTPESLDLVQKYFKGERVSNDNKLICVFGSAGGGRDKWKRPEMGRVAASNCDVIILTDEDPYNEDPKEIIRQIKSGIEKSIFNMDDVYEIVDRKKAIEKAISIAKNGDVVVFTGKGSEESIHKDNDVIESWNESDVVKNAIIKKLA